MAEVAELGFAIFSGPIKDATDKMGEVATEAARKLGGAGTVSGQFLDV